MADRHILYRQRAALQGGKVAVASEVELLGSYTGVVFGSSDVETGLVRLDGTGQGAGIETFQGSFTADSTNLSIWFKNRQQSRLRCIDDGAIIPPVFSLPGTAALTAAFNILQGLSVPEIIRLIIEYTGPSTTFLRVQPRDSLSPQIGGISSAVVRTGTFATMEITRTGGVIGNYVYQDQAPIGDADVFGGIRLISPSSEIWDASANGPLPDPSTVAKENAYKVFNAPADGSGRFGEVMQNGDWVVAEADTFTSWSATPLQWFVLPAHEVRRITALEQDFLGDVALSPVSDRNTIVRGANYADTAGEIRLKIYPTIADYTAADLNTTGDIDEYTDPADQTGHLAIRFAGTQATLASVLPTLYVFAEDSGTFSLVGNLVDDFIYEGDFGAESDYITRQPITYGANTVLRVYFGTVVDRYNTPNLDVSEQNLLGPVQQKLNRTDGQGNVDEQRLVAVENKTAALYPLTPDVNRLVDWAEIFTPDNPSQRVREVEGYSLIADYRSDTDRYESTGVTYDNTGTNVVTYTGLTNNLHRIFGFLVTAPANQVLMWLVDGANRIPFLDITLAGNFRINNYREVITEGSHVTNQIHFLTRTGGDDVVSTSPDSLSTFTITDYPTGATETSRTVQIDADIYLNGVDTTAGHLFEITDVPAGVTAQARNTVVVTAGLGPLYGNRSVTLTAGYAFRVSGSDLLMDLTLVSAPSDITVRFTDVATLLNYTAPATTTRVDNFKVFTDGLGDYTFSGNTNLLIGFQPHPISNTLNAVPVAINAAGTVTELNDRVVPIPADGFQSVEVNDTLEFRTALPDHFLRHSDLSALVRRASTKWCYGLALLEEVSEHRITGELEFDSFVLIGTVNNTRVRVTLDDTNTADLKFKLEEI